MVYGFHGIARVGVMHFFYLYKEDQRANVASKLEIIDNFPSFVSNEQNNALNEPIC